MPVERLRPLDAVVWELQPPSMMTLLLSFGARPGGDTPTFGEYLSRVQQRLEPRDIPPSLRFLRQRIRRTRASLGDPFFEDDPGFDVRHHVRRIPFEAPAPADRLAELMVGAMSRPFDVDRPLWRVDVVDAVSDGSFALYMTLHHAMGDGLFGLTVASFLALDDGETGPGSSDPESRWVPERTPPPVRLAIETLGSRARGYAASWGATRGAGPAPGPLLRLGVPRPDGVALRRAHGCRRRAPRGSHDVAAPRLEDPAVPTLPARPPHRLPCVRRDDHGSAPRRGGGGLARRGGRSKGAVGQRPGEPASSRRQLAAPT